MEKGYIMTTPVYHAAAAEAEIIRAEPRNAPAGQIIERSALGATTPDDHCPHTVSGDLDDPNRPAARDAGEEVTGSGGPIKTTAQRIGTAIRNTYLTETVEGTKSDTLGISTAGTSSGHDSAAAHVVSAEPAAPEARVDHVKAIPPIWDNIPEDLKNVPQWVAWKYAVRGGKLTKIPVNAKTGGQASTSDKSTWCCYLDAKVFCESHVGFGAGYVSRASIRRAMEAGRFPKCIRIGRCVMWKRAEIVAWVEANCPAVE